jgi:hypothetical protein
MDKAKDKVTSGSKRLSIDSIDFENEIEFMILDAQVLLAGNEIVRAERKEMMRKGIIDSDGNLLKRELPEDMREGAERDFGG